MTGRMLSYDERVRIVDARARGIHAKEIAECFGISEREVYRLTARARRDDLALRVHDRGRKPKMTDEQMENLRCALEETPDKTLGAIREELSLPVSESRLSRIVREMGFRLKKKVIHASEQERPRRR